MSDLVYLKLTNGEGIVAETKLEPENGKYGLVRPLKLVIETRPDGLKDILLVAWIPISITDQDSVYIKSDNVLYVVPLHKEVSTYISNYTENLYKKDKTPQEPSSPTNIDEVIGAMTKVNKKLQ